MNMSYCRFENTSQDLKDCLEHITDTDLNRYELPSRRNLIETCKEILETLGAEVECWEEVLDGLDTIEENNDIEEEEEEEE